MSTAEKLLLGITRDFIQCVTDPNGIHVIQKLIEQVTNSGAYHTLQFMIDAFSGNVFQLARNKYACRVLQKLWQKCPNWMCIDLFDEILCSDAVIASLAMDEYGNYVLQNLMINCRIPRVFEKMLSCVIPKFVQFAKHKFSSNVAETAFELSNYRQKQRILDHLLLKQRGTGMVRMIEDQFGNYVAQKIIDVLVATNDMNESRKCAFKRLVPRLQQSFKCHKFGRNVLFRLQCM
jgi:hypothetical protein